MSDVRDTIARLLPFADPARFAHKRLLHLQQRIADGIMLGATDRRFLQELQDRLDNQECAHLRVIQMACAAQPGKRCTYTARFDACPLFELPKPGRDRDPIRPVRTP